MDEEKIKLPIHSALIPVFYQNFHCLAQDCRDSCCVDWSITFDKKDYLRLRRLDAPEELKQRLEQGVRRQRKGKHDGVLYGHFDLNANHGRRQGIYFVPLLRGRVATTLGFAGWGSVCGGPLAQGGAQDIPCTQGREPFVLLCTPPGHVH